MDINLGKPPSPDAITLDRVTKLLGGRTTLSNVAFSVKRGDIFGYLGPNGAGKTTSIRIMLGLLRPTTGKAYILGQDSAIDSSRRNVGFILEADGLYENLTAEDNLAFYAKIYGVPQPNLIVEQALASVALGHRARDKVGTFSKGMRQRLALARSIIHDPEVLILDEPTAGIDPSGQIEVRELILEMTRRRNKTVFLSSHNLDEVQRICNRIALIHRGEIKLYGELEQLQRQRSKKELEIETAEIMPKALLDELKSLSVSLVRQDEKVAVLAMNSTAGVPDVVNFLTGRGARIEQVKRREASLEEIYSSILKETGQV